MMDLVPFKQLIREKCGLTFEGVREPILVEEIRARVQVTRSSSESQYFSRLINDKEELSLLLDRLTINETYFFREVRHLDFLVDKVMPGLLERARTGQKVRILSAGCSSGEEPFSICMSIAERFGADQVGNVSVLGLDLDREAIERARRGSFQSHSFRNISGVLKNKYFESDEAGLFRIVEFIKKSVQFHVFNLLSDKFPQDFGDLDAIFYRNVSIYFAADTQLVIFRKLADLLRPEGFIFVGITETLTHQLGILPLIDRDGVFAFQKVAEIPEAKKVTKGEKSELCGRTPAGGELSLRGGQAVASEGAAKQSGPARLLRFAPDDRESSVEFRQHPLAGNGKPARVAESGPEGQDLFLEVQTLARAGDFEGALERIDDLLEQDSGFPRRSLMKASILINLEKFEEADRICLETLESDRLSLEAYLLLGFSAKIRADETGALKRFMEALYVKPACWLAHFQLAQIHKYLGNAKHSAAEFGIVLKLLADDPDPGADLAIFPVPFSVDQIVRISQQNLRRLRGS